ncbi:proline-rich protein 34-like [Ursus maritimus]|uniref:Proline-rich protein 34-like n=1 Tax=Ursus maritimus TaxID=29073 RepID=A0A8M1FLY2_URSMA|nr:proline-rich protein 34-like [Ursus maritimus]
MSPTSTSPPAPPRALPPAPGSGRAAASLPSGRGAPGAGARRSRPGAGALCAQRAALLLPGGRPAALQINASPSSTLAVRSAGRPRALRRRLRGLVVSARGRVAADTLASRGKARRALAPSPRRPVETTGSFICSSDPVADGGTLQPCAV